MSNLMKQKNTTGKLLEFDMVRHIVENKVRKSSNNGRHNSIYQGQGKILLALSQSDGLSQKELSTRLDLTAQSTAEFVNKLVKKQLVTKEKSTSDRRVVIIRLTDQGRQVIEKETAKVPDYLSTLTDDELDQLANILTKINTNLYSEINDSEHSNLLNKSQQAIKDTFRDWFL
ncbi:MarR family winged helix-turn-helix transcriptional regulator [Companilactobacillus sp. HBUAS59699]|uniref:MarR family winged helix-turn-helix transcriptional regulator n=1 Tax=Companilactobacillus sp. HBUAS59699 TaxID=3109358 RepID=UPI002FF39F2D